MGKVEVAELWHARATGGTPHNTLLFINRQRRQMYIIISKLILPLSVYYWLQLTIMYLELSERDYSSSPWGPTSPRGRLLRRPFIAHAQFEGSPSCSLAQLGDPVESIYHKWLSRNRIKFHKVWVYLKIKALSIRWTYPLQNTHAHFFVNQYQSYVDPMAVFPASDNTMTGIWGVKMWLGQGNKCWNHNEMVNFQQNN